MIKNGMKIEKLFASKVNFLLFFCVEDRITEDSVRRTIHWIQFLIFSNSAQPLSDAFPLFYYAVQCDSESSLSTTQLAFLVVIIVIMIIFRFLSTTVFTALFCARVKWLLLQMVKVTKLILFSNYFYNHYFQIPQKKILLPRSFSKIDKTWACALSIEDNNGLYWARAPCSSPNKCYTLYISIRISFSLAVK